MDRKTIIIGLDGATFDVIDPYVKAGVMPNLGRMIREGAAGDLESTVPPVTGPSWVSFMTGMGPGKHGIFDFVKPVPGSLRRQAVTYDDIKVKTIWRRFNEAGKTVGVVNVPLTYPAPKVDGFCIPGLLTPSDFGEFAHPEGLMAELRKNTGGYILDVWWQQYGGEGAETFLEKMIDCTRQRIKAFKYLMENRQWDVFTGIFIGTDRIQHYLWHLIHPEDRSKLTERERKISAKISEYYRVVDDYFGYLLNNYENYANIIVISDHGFGKLGKKMSINRWLEEAGYLHIHREQLDRTKRGMKVMQALRAAVRVIDPFGFRKAVGKRFGLSGRMNAYRFLDCIDWAKTSAYSASGTEQGIYLNVKGREPQGILERDEFERVRDEIIARLKNLKDPDTGANVDVTIYKSEEFYTGPYVNSAPDIMVFLKNGEYLVDVQPKESVFEDAGWHTGFGTHRLEGILIGYGPDIKKSAKVIGARIIDVAPTLLYLNGMPVPNSMDGRPLVDMINQEFSGDRPPVFFDEDGYDSSGGGERTLSEDEMRKVEESLKGLGYL